MQAVPLARRPIDVAVDVCGDAPPTGASVLFAVPAPSMVSFCALSKLLGSAAEMTH